MKQPPKKVAGVRGPIPEAGLKQLAGAYFTNIYGVTWPESILHIVDRLGGSAE
jgi:hypothetical protein